MPEEQLLELESELVDYVPGEENQDKPTEKPDEKQDQKPDQEEEKSQVEDKEEEVPEEKEEEKEGDSPEGKGQAEGEEESEKATDPKPEEEEQSDEEVFTDLSQKSGVDVNSYDDVVNSLKELKKLKEDPYNGVSSLLKEAIKAEQQGIDPGRFIQLSKTDFDKMDAKEVLREQFMTKHAAMFQRNRSFAEKKFEVEFNAKYGAVNKKEDPDTMDENEIQQLREEKQFAKDSLDYDASVAKDELNALKQKALTPESNKEEDEKPQLSQEEIDKLREKDQKENQSIVDDIENIEIPFGKEKVNIQISNKEKEVIREALNTPLEALKEFFGIDTVGEKFNKEVFANAMAWHLAYGKAADIIGKLAVEKENKKIIDKMEHSKKVESKTNKPTSIEDEMEGPDSFR